MALQRSEPFIWIVSALVLRRLNRPLRPSEGYALRKYKDGCLWPKRADITPLQIGVACNRDGHGLGDLVVHAAPNVRPVFYSFHYHLLLATNVRKWRDSAVA